MTIYSCPSWNAVTVISTNEIFARVSINTGFPLTLISICERRENKEQNKEQTQKQITTAPSKASMQSKHQKLILNIGRALKPFTYHRILMHTCLQQHMHVILLFPWPKLKKAICQSGQIPPWPPQAQSLLCHHGKGVTTTNAAFCNREVMGPSKRILLSKLKLGLKQLWIHLKLLALRPTTEELRHQKQHTYSTFSSINTMPEAHGCSLFRNNLQWSPKLQEYLPSWHVAPIHCCGQIHSNALTPSMQVPP